MRVDFIVAGQGICGTFLSYYLLQAGMSVIVVDRPVGHTASRIASGVINPVTGRRIVKTWMIDALLPFAREAYRQMERYLGEKVVSDCPVLEFHPTLQMQQAFVKRLSEQADYLSDASADRQWCAYFRYAHGIGCVQPALHIDLQTLLDSYRDRLKKEDALREEYFDIAQLQVGDTMVQYKDIEAGKILFCDGVGDIPNPYFKGLPFAPNKGEAIIVEIPDLPSGYIYKQGLSLVPWNMDTRQFWIGSTYNWQYEDVLPTKEFADRVASVLEKWLKIPYKKIAHFAAERPANTERRPFVGVHPVYSSLGILNGMGTKGCSLAPYFGKQLVDHLLKGTEIDPLADIKRFAW